MSIKLSCILPCYGVEKYISECLNSLYNQDIPLSEYEVICINDCSVDRTVDVINHYKENFPNLTLINHEINKKQGGARNTGLSVAKGEYVWFIDPDDFIQSNIFSKILLYLKDRLDILLFNYFKLLTNGNIFKEITLPDSDQISGYDICLEIDRIWDLCWLPFKIFRYDFLIENKIVFLDFNYFEDLDFVLRAICYAQKVQSISECIYYYRQNPLSTSHQISIQIKKGYIMYMSFIFIGKRIIDLSKEVQEKRISEILLQGGIDRINKFTKPLLKATYKERIRFFILLNENKSIISDIYNNFNITNKIIVKNHLLVQLISFFIYPIFRILIVFRGYGITPNN